MRCVKILGLLAVAAAATMAFAGPAAASSVTSPSGTVFTGSVHAVSEGYVITHNSVGTLSCNSTLAGNVIGHGASVTAQLQITTWHFTGCTDGTIHPVTQPGTLEFHPLGNGNATITWVGGKITKTMFGFECGYSSGSGIHIGEATAGEHATLHIKASLPRTHGSFFCGSSGNWTGSYKIRTPTNIAFS